ncbi:hypothetical protein, partial [Stigmatella erecta]|uniref:hypothetical protein n=1 Tax=Stigmatella erecta TaxID=83460 RepID=UPI001C430F39
MVGWKGDPVFNGSRASGGRRNEGLSQVVDTRGGEEVEAAPPGTNWTDGSKAGQEASRGLTKRIVTGEVDGAAKNEVEGAPRRTK